MLLERAILKPIEIRLTENGSNPDVQVLRVGKFTHPKYGEFEITPRILSEMKSNFDRRIRGIDIAFDYFHDSDKAASGWPTELFLTEDKNELWAKVEWTPTASRMLSEREVRYFSPDFAFRWQDPETGVFYNNVLFGGGLTNRPFVKDMAAIVADEKGAIEMKTVEELQKALKLSEDKVAEQEKKMADMAAIAPKQDEVAALKTQIAELTAKLEKLTGDSEVAMAEKKKLEEQVALSEKEKEFNILLTEGKACVAQKAAFIKGDMTAFIKLSEGVNLAGKGHSGGTTETGDKDSRVLKLAEEKRKADPKLSHGESISLALKEVKE